jgi:hypothetical protein
VEDNFMNNAWRMDLRQRLLLVIVLALAGLLLTAAAADYKIEVVIINESVYGYDCGTTGGMWNLSHKAVVKVKSCSRSPIVREPSRRGGGRFGMI